MQQTTIIKQTPLRVILTVPCAVIKQIPLTNTRTLPYAVIKQIPLRMDVKIDLNNTTNNTRPIQHSIKYIT
jgi:hypothetical protein